MLLHVFGDSCDGLARMLHWVMPMQVWPRASSVPLWPRLRRHLWTMLGSCMGMLKGLRQIQYTDGRPRPRLGSRLLGVRRSLPQAAGRLLGRLRHSLRQEMVLWMVCAALPVSGTRVWEQARGGEGRARRRGLRWHPCGPGRQAWAPCEGGVVGVAAGLAPKERCLPPRGRLEL